MKTLRKLLPIFLLLPLAALILPTANAQDHSAAYAMSNLRYARALLLRPDGSPSQDPELKATQQIDRALDDIKKAFTEEGATLNNHPPVDPRQDWANRLRQAMQLVNTARRYVVQAEGSVPPQNLQKQVLDDIDGARRYIEQAIHLVQ
jgi:hypothetical protein